MEAKVSKMPFPNRILNQTENISANNRLHLSAPKSKLLVKCFYMEAMFMAASEWLLPYDGRVQVAASEWLLLHGCFFDL